MRERERERERRPSLGAAQPGCGRRESSHAMVPRRRLAALTAQMTARPELEVQVAAAATRTGEQLLAGVGKMDITKPDVLVPGVDVNLVQVRPNSRYKVSPSTLHILIAHRAFGRTRARPRRSTTPCTPRRC